MSSGIATPFPLEFLFRGTTEGFPGRAFFSVGVTSMSADPVVATLFALTASKRGKPVVHIIPVPRLTYKLVDRRRPQDQLASIEAEIAVEASPEEIAKMSTTISAGASQKILEKLGVKFPPSIYNLADLDTALRLTKRLSHEEIRAFICGVEEEPC